MFFCSGLQAASTCECHETAGAFCEFDKAIYEDLEAKLNAVAKQLQILRVNERNYVQVLAIVSKLMGYKYLFSGAIYQ